MLEKLLLKAVGIFILYGFKIAYIIFFTIALYGYIVKYY